MEKMIIINAPYIFSFFWQLIKIWLDKSTTDKIKIYSNSAKKEIFKACDPSKIPTFMGGTCEIPLEQEPGPWKKEIKKSIDKQHLILPNRSLEHKYFLSQDEILSKKNNLSSTQSTIKSKNSKEYYLDSLREIDEEKKNVGNIRISNIMIKF